MQENKEGEGREWRREGSETLFHNIKQSFFNLEARAHIPENDQRTTGERVTRDNRTRPVSQHAIIQ